MSKRVRGEMIAAPKYSRGSVVSYWDRQNRPQRGKVLGIDAHWASYSAAGTKPLFVYAVEHPSYTNGRFYCGEDALFGVAA